MGYNLLINGVCWGYNPLILTFDPNFLGHPSSRGNSFDDVVVLMDQRLDKESLNHPARTAIEIPLKFLRGPYAP